MTRFPPLRLLHASILLTFALIPVWYRLPRVPPLLPDLYVSRFLILLPMLLTIAGWLALGLPGLADLRCDAARRTWALALLLLALWGFASQGWAYQRIQHPEAAATAALQFGIAALFAVVVACAGPPRRAIIAVLVVSLTWNSLVGGIQVAAQGSIGLSALGEFPLSIDQTGISVVQAGALRWLRPYGLLPHPNMLAGVLVLGLMGAGAWILSARRRVWITATLLASGGLWALGLTFSRAAWGGLVVGLLATLPFLWRGRWIRRRHLLTAALLLLTAGLFFLHYRPFLLARAGVNQESIEQRSISDRRVFTEFALRAIGENPLLGVGIGNFPWKASFYLMSLPYDLQGDNVHNIYLSAWAELGVIGLALYGVALLAGLFAAARHLRAQPDRSGGMLLGGVVALLALGLLDHYPYTLIQFQVALWGLLAAAAGEGVGGKGCEEEAVSGPQFTDNDQAPIPSS
ncbi:MAG: O-antigen ligase family protein [Anaerolineae bacterium]|nr:O-antigen ligase family protein [Anaerolineae bacterium]